MSLDQPKSADALPSRDLMPKDLSPEAIQRRISEQLRKTDAAAEKNQPSIDSNHLREAVGNPEPPIFMWVKTGQIVGRPFFGGGKNGWEVEYGGREGRIEQVRDEIMDSAASVANIEHIFHPSDSGERIKLTEFDGPAGPIFIVEDGTHRVAGAKAANLDEIPCDVHTFSYPRELSTKNKNVAYEWEKRIKCGLISGKIDELEDGAFVMTIRGEAVPWAAVSSQSKFLEISKIYERIFPNGLQGLSVPREALIDPVANNFFLSGRWSEWKDK